MASTNNSTISVAFKLGVELPVGWVTVVGVECIADQVVVANDSNPIRVAIKLGWSQCNMFRIAR